MPGRRDRYKPLREAAHQAENKQSSQEEEKKGPHEQRTADAHAAQEIQAEIAEHGPTRPPDIRPRSPGWTPDAPMPDQFASALKYDRWVNSAHNQRPEVPQQAQQNQQAPEQSDQQSSRNFAALRNEHSKAPEREETSAEQTRETQQESRNSDLAPNPVIQRRLDAKAAIQRAGAEVTQPAHTQPVSRTTDARPGQNHQPQSDQSTSRDTSKTQQQNDGERTDSAPEPNPEIQRRRDAKTAIENDITPDGSSRTKESNQQQPELATNERTFQRSGRDDDR